MNQQDTLECSLEVEKTEIAELLARLNDTDYEYDLLSTVREIFENQVEKTPDNIAIRFNNQYLTYKELNSKANALATCLRSKGLNKEEIVGIRAERSLEMIIAIYGIIKAGGAYLPISPNDPDNRVQHIISDSNIRFLLTYTNSNRSFLGQHEVIDLKSFDFGADLIPNLPNINTCTDLLYVIYTSGSTGQPKGVMVEHRSVINRIRWMQRKYPISETDCILQKTSYNFDVSVWEIFWWAFEGAQLCLPSPNHEKIPLAIVNLIEEYKVTVIHFVPSMLSVFLDYVRSTDSTSKLSSLRILFSSGEALSTKNVEECNALFSGFDDFLLSNLYGPTEATVDVTHYDCEKGGDNFKVPIGKPIDNTKIYIINEKGCTSVGESGELCISGVCLARGYLNNVELTEQKFVQNPYLPGQRMYKTGDLARRLPDGNIDYINRIDNQVKIRGLRIELGEIESVLIKFPSIKECLVLTKQYSESVIILVGYYISDLPEPIVVKDLKAFLMLYLPEYMVPNVFMKIPHMPLTANGKADRKSLPAPF